MTAATPSISSTLDRMTDEIARLSGFVHKMIMPNDDLAICNASRLEGLPQTIAWDISGFGNPGEKVPAQQSEADRAAKLAEMVEVFLSAAEILLSSPIRSSDTIVPSGEQTEETRKENHGSAAAE
jgi:hypothetical protein